MVLVHFYGLMINGIILKKNERKYEYDQRDLTNTILDINGFEETKLIKNIFNEA